MKNLVLDIAHIGSHSIVFEDHAKADEAYAKLTAAQAACREYGNDKNRTVEIAVDHGMMTVTVPALYSVIIQDIDASFEHDKRVTLALAKRKAALKGVSDPDSVHQYAESE